MREHSLGELGAAWAQLVATYGQARPDLAGAVLGAVQRYVPWIDIGLVANDKRAPAPRQALCAFFVGPTMSKQCLLRGAGQAGKLYDDARGEQTCLKH